MDSIMKKTRLAEKRHRDKMKEEKKEIRSRINTRNQKKQNNKMEKNREQCKDFNHPLQKTQKLINKLKKYKRYEMNKRRNFNSKKTEPNKINKQLESKQKRESIIKEDINLGRFFELSLSDKYNICLQFKFT